MASITDKLGLVVWDGLQDPYNNLQLADNFQKISFHDHTPGHGVPIASGGLAPGSVGSINFDSSAINLINFQSLSVRSGVIASTTVAPSELVIVTGGEPLNVSLPAPLVNTRVGIVVAQGATATLPVTVLRSGSAVIYGAGLPGVTSFLLGTNGSRALLQADGVNWYLISGERDTGWLPFAFNAALYRDGGFGLPVAYRAQGDRVLMRGIVSRNSSNIVAGQLIGTLPVAYAPLQQDAFMCGGGGTGDAAVVEVDVDGSVIAVTTMISDAGGFLWLGNIGYSRSV